MSHRSKYESFTLSKVLKKQNKLDDRLEVALSQLTIEELIGLKLELASRAAGNKLYGLPIVRAMPRIAQEACILYSMSAAKTKAEAARFLGLNKMELKKLIYKYDLKTYFDEILE